MAQGQEGGHEATDIEPTSLPALSKLFLKLGTLGFGGPAAHIALMEDEVVRRRGWLDRQRFLDMVGATNLIPGPNSTEMAIHVGYARAGWPGLLVAGASFILPAVLITIAFAWAYVAYGSLPEVQPWLLGIQPAVLAVILGALVRLGRTAVASWRLAVIAAGVTAAVVLDVNVLVALGLGGIAGTLWLAWPELRGGPPAAAMLAAPVAWLAQAGKVRVLQATAVAGAAGVSLWKLGLFFLKVGAVLYGSGYVLVAFLEDDLVHGYGWLTEGELLDAIAIGQFTPGPVLSTAAFIGYLLAGWPGAGISAVAIFLPSFVFVAMLGPLLPKVRKSTWAGWFLDAVNASALGVMAGVLLSLSLATLTAWPAWVIAAGAALAVVAFRVPSVWIILAGALGGWLLSPWLG